MDEGVLQTRTGHSNLLYLEFLGAERAKTQLGFITNTFTTVAQLQEITNDLYRQGVTPMVTCFGTGKGGVSAESSVLPLEKN